MAEAKTEKKIRKARNVVRTSFEKLYTIVTNKDTTTNEDYIVSCKLIQEKYDEMILLDQKLFELMLERASEEELAEEIELNDKYKKQFYNIKVEVDTSDKKSVINISERPETSEQRFRLPKIEIKKFDGEPRNWLLFWGLFKKVDGDVNLSNEEKFQYLVQSTVAGSRARTVVTSFPPTKENYPKAVGALKERFGREDVLIDVYIRELLSLVNRPFTSLSQVYDKLECQLRALDSLNVTSEKCSLILYPMVESCLPEEVLRIWQRSGQAGSSARDRLDRLVEFIRGEVQNEERIAMAVSGLKTLDPVSRQNRRVAVHPKTPATAAGLVNGSTQLQMVNQCIFCDKNHKYFNCDKLQKMTYGDKKQSVLAKKLCFLCLKSGHGAKYCKSEIKCTICGYRHNVIFCSKTQETVSKEHSLASVVKTSEVYLQTFMVKLRGPNGIARSARALIDTASQRSYVLDRTAKEIGFSVEGKENIVSALFGGVTRAEKIHTVYRARLSSLDESYNCNLVTLGERVICGPIKCVNSKSVDRELNDNGIEVKDMSGDVEILIGADVAGKLMTGRLVQLSSGLTAVQTWLGWTILGRKKGIECKKSSKAMVVTSMLVKNMKINDLWELDVLGIKDPAETKSRKEIEEATVQHFRETVDKDEDGRYLVHLPWTEGHQALPTNYDLAVGRLEHTLRKLRNEKYYNEYDNVFKTWVDEDIIEEVKDDNPRSNGHYLPHRPVIKPHSTTRVRPVFDASAHEYQSPSLNSCLDKGINLIEQIGSIIHGFRLKKIGFIADIEKAFLQIGVNENDRNFLRFLWKDEEGNVKIFRHKRVVFGVTSSPFLLMAVIMHHLDELLSQDDISSGDKDLITQLKKCFYVDNFVYSVNSLSELKDFINKSVKFLSLAKFNLRGWEFSETTPTDTTDTDTNVLGLKWDKSDDTLSVARFDLESLKLDKITKRTILSLAHKIFDTIGFTSPVSLYPKLLIQSVCEKGLKWDEEIDGKLKDDFVNWTKGLKDLFGIKIPRSFGGDTSKWKHISIHTFSDASKLAYAAACFLRVETSEGVHVQLIVAKSRVAPSGQKLTIPRLELLGATIAVRLCKDVCQSLLPSLRQIDNNCELRFWTDSTTVLAWIVRREPWAVFVKNRVDEILKFTSIDQWAHVPGQLNPADLPSRGCSAQKLVASKWWEGPDWLRQPHDSWPKSDINFIEEEICCEKRKTIVSCISQDVTIDDWYFKYFSNYSKMLRMVAWIKRFAFNCRKVGCRIKGELTAIEVEEAELVVLRLVQEESFPNVESDKSIMSLFPYKDERGIIRIKTQLINKEDSLNFRSPILLPAKHAVVERLIREKHRKACHVGLVGLMSLLREDYWVLGGRRTVRSVIKSCVSCKRYEAKRMETLPAPLPADRVNEVSVFKIVGVDLAGPVFLKDKSKAWICIFTCAVYRAVHLELLSSAGTECFLQALRRFIGRRGRPNVIYSDNGLNFVGTDHAFKKLDWDAVQKYGSINKITWRFNVPTGAWWGGWWERLIRLLKQLLRRTLGRSCLNFEELTTILCDCEGVINKRPISYVHDTSNQLTPLTPLFFLSDNQESNVYDIDVVESNGEMLSRRAEYRKRLCKELRERFRSEYLGALHHRYNGKGGSKLSIGDIVVIGIEGTKRLEWPLGKVKELIKGKDGVIRVVRLTTSRGELLRPIQRLYHLEIVEPKRMIEKTARGNMLTENDSCENLPFHGFDENDIAEIHNNIPEEEVSDSASHFEQELEIQRSRSGRVIKPPIKLCD